MDLTPTTAWPAPHDDPVTPVTANVRTPGAAELAWHHDADGCAVIGPGGIVSDANPAFADCIGRPRGAVVGLDLFDVFAPDDILGPFGDAGPTSWWSVAGIGGDDVPFLAELSTSALVGHDRVVRVRSRRPLIERSDSSRDEATGSVRHALAHALSHDIRGRLGVVTGFLDLAADGDDPAADSELVARATAAAHVADRMMQRLVRHVRLGDAVFRLGPTPLDGVVAEAAAGVEGAATVHVGPLPTVFGDRSLLLECFAELFHNAVEYGGERPTISITATTTGRWCEIRVSDDGPGIDASQIDETFVVFRQLQPRNWERGLGMGLPICRRIVDGHGGSLRLESDGTTGTTAVLRLALAGPAG